MRNPRDRMLKNNAWEGLWEALGALPVESDLREVLEGQTPPREPELLVEGRC